MMSKYACDLHADVPINTPRLCLTGIVNCIKTILGHRPIQFSEKGFG